MSKALALLEFGSIAAGVSTVDRMLKRSPVALLRCGTVHPGRFLALVGGTVAATEEAHAEGVALGVQQGVLVDEVCLADPHASLHSALVGNRTQPVADTVGVIEVSTCPALLRVVDAVLKAVPVSLVELRLADDLGGRALAVIDGELADVNQAMTLAGSRTGSCGELLGATVLPRLDPTLRLVLAEGTRFGTCRNWQPEDAETGTR